MFLSSISVQFLLLHTIYRKTTYRKMVYNDIGKINTDRNNIKGLKF